MSVRLVVTDDGWVAEDASPERGSHQAVARLVATPPETSLPYLSILNSTLLYNYTRLLVAKGPARMVLRNCLGYVMRRVAHRPLWNEARAREDTWRSV